MKFTLQICK